MNGRGLAIVFAEDEPTIKDSYQPGKDHSYPPTLPALSSEIFLN